MRTAATDREVGIAIHTQNNSVIFCERRIVVVVGINRVSFIAPVSNGHSQAREGNSICTSVVSTGHIAGIRPVQAPGNFTAFGVGTGATNVDNNLRHCGRKTIRGATVADGEVKNIHSFADRINGGCQPDRLSNPACGGEGGVGVSALGGEVHQGG